MPVDRAYSHTELGGQGELGHIGVTLDVSSRVGLRREVSFEVSIIQNSVAEL